jgi:crotonobetainyl-CoA:carnitine CoA-transferase CaiB-like acyl-CoA transferase
MAIVDLPLDGILILDFSQFLAGPVAALRLADLGATVIKVERPVIGDIGRGLAFAGKYIDGESVSFHSMNRNKFGITADLKNIDDLIKIKKLIEKADVIVQNFRPGVMERIGLDYETVKKINPRLIYASVSGYGDSGPWKDRPGQDLLAQSLSGLPWLSGTSDSGPVPFGLSIADHLASCHLAEGITALLVRRARTGLGGLVETSLLESMLDLQFELLGARLNDSTVKVDRKGNFSAHAFLSAPYGIYPTTNGFLSIAMNPVDKLGRILDIPALIPLTEESDWWTQQELIETLLASKLASNTTEFWLTKLDAEDIWCAPLLSLDELLAHDGFQAIDMVQVIERGTTQIKTTRSPIRIDGQKLNSNKAAPRLGEDTEKILSFQKED